MKVNSKSKTVIKWSIGVVVALVILLFAHIAVMVKQMPKPSNFTIQLARVDFHEPVDTSSVRLIQSRILKLRGVKSTYFNTTDNILVYAFDNNLNQSQAIYDAAIKECGLKSSRYVIHAQDAGKGCPAFDNNSLYGKVTQFVSSVIN